MKDVTFRESFAGSPADLEWLSDDSSTRISIPATIVDHIAGYVIEAYKSIPRRGAETGGLLIGNVNLGAVTQICITVFEPVHCDYRFGPSFILPEGGQTEFHSSLARYPNNEILGYYRSHTRPDFGPQTSDREIVEHVFPGVSGLLLLIKPSGAFTLTANYFFFESGHPRTASAGPDFRFVGSIPGGTPPLHVDVVPPVTQTVQPTPAIASEAPIDFRTPPSAEVVESGKRRTSLQWEIVAAGFMIAAALGLLWWQYHGATGEQDASSSQSATGTQSALGRVASLGLAVQPGQGSWRVTWDPNSPAAHDSARGALDVTEATSHDRIPLTAAQIHAGTASYLPTGDDIAFRLELFALDNSLSSETYRVLLKPRQEAAGAQPAANPSTRLSKPMPKAETPAATPAAAAAPYVESEVVNRVSPEVSEGIRSRITLPQGIDIRVSIDSEGRVTSAYAIQHEEGLINFLGDRAVAAARQWTFTPAKRGDIPVASTRTIHFVFEH